MADVTTEKPAIAWAQSQLGGGCEYSQLEKSASARLYYRLRHDGQPMILMDASKEIESAQLFYTLAKDFSELGLRVPRINWTSLDDGWLLIEDFGQQQLLSLLENTPECAEHWYRLAFHALMRLQAADNVLAEQLPMFDAAWARRESMRAITEFLPVLPETLRESLDREAMVIAIEDLVATVVEQHFCVSHRDFHAGNLMCLQNGELGILDFQSAFNAPMTYDIASLLRDCYIDWPPEQVEKWLQRFFQDSALWQASFTDFSEFKRAFDEASLQRHLKCIGLFVYLADQGQVGYLSALPRTLRYIQQVCQSDTRWQALLPLATAGLRMFS